MLQDSRLVMEEETFVSGFFFFFKSFSPREASELVTKEEKALAEALKVGGC